MERGKERERKREREREREGARERERELVLVYKVHKIFLKVIFLFVILIVKVQLNPSIDGCFS